MPPVIITIGFFAALLLGYSATAHAAKGVITGSADAPICELDNGDYCYNPDLAYPSGTTLCDVWNESAGTCSLGEVSGGHGSGIGVLERAPAQIRTDPVVTPVTPPVRPAESLQREVIR